MDTFRRDLQLAALDDLDRLDRPVARLGLDVLDLLHDVVALENLTEDDMTAVQPTVGASALVRLLPSSSHNKKKRREMTYGVTTVVMKNWEPLVSLPALAIERRPFLECLSLKFSSGNVSP